MKTQHPAPLNRFRSLRLVLATLPLLFFVSVFGAEAAKMKFDVPAGEAGQTLRQFAAQARREILFPVQPVGAVKTAAVQGELTVKEGLDQLLAGTELTAIEDAKTGAIVVKRDASPNAPRVAQAATTPANSSVIESGKLVLETYEVTGSRLSSLSGEHPMQPVVTLTSLDIARTGATSLGQLFQYIPQVSSYTSGDLNVGTVSAGTFTGATVNSSIGGARTGASLRGGTGLGTLGVQTLLLVNGRRVGKSGQNDNQDGYDLGSIPLAAIERVEVLLDGASAIYGSDAINGAINVILKKHYRGSEIRLSYGSAFDTDTAEKTGSFTSGFGSGKLSGLISVSWSESNALKSSDRAIIASADRRPYGGTDRRTVSTIGNIPGGSGAISSTNGLPLPGLTLASVAIPAGSDGRNVTVAQYQAAGAPAPIYDPLEAYWAIGEGKKHGMAGHLEYDFNERLKLSFDARASETWTSAVFPPLSLKNFTIPVGYPGNPFGVPVRLSKIFFDEPVPNSGAVSRNSGFTLAAAGRLSANWRYDISADYTRLYQHGLNNGIGVIFNSALLNAAIASSTPPVLLHDSTTGTSPALASYAIPSTRQVDLAENRTYLAQANGSLWSLPSGEIRMVVGVEYRDERFRLPSFPDRSAALVPEAVDRTVKAAFGEARIPLVSAKQGIPLLRQLDASLAFRIDDYNDFGRGENPRYGVAWQPAKGLTLRASYGTGFNVPNLRDVYAFPAVVGPLPGSTVGPDPLRGNTPPPGLILLSFGGHPGLRPESSESRNAGLTWDVPVLKGLSLGFNWYENRYTDKIGQQLPLAILAVSFPDRVTRGPKLPGDPAEWLGPLTQLDWRAVNIATARTSGYDVSARWTRVTGWGEFNVGVNLTGYIKNEAIATPGATPNPAINEDSLPLQGAATFFWSRAAISSGLTLRYKGKFQQVPPNSIWTESNSRLDWQVSYDFGRTAGQKRNGGAWWRAALKDSRVDLTIYNVLDTDPNIVPGGYFDLSIIDIRQQYFSLQFTRKF